MIFLLSGIAVTVIGVVVLILAIYGNKKYISKNIRCTASTDGTLVRYEKKNFVENNSDGSTYNESYFYSVYEYFVNDQRFEVQSGYGKRTITEPLIGQKKQIWYNPENCSECFISGEDLSKAYGIAKIIGIVLIAVGVVDLLAYLATKLFF